MRRTLLGIVALALLIAGSCLWFQANDEHAVTTAVLMRSGLLLAAIWLALPQLVELFQRFPPWIIAAVCLSLVVLVARPRSYVVVVPLLLVLGALQFLGWLMKPPPGSKRE